LPKTKFLGYFFIADSMGLGLISLKQLALKVNTISEYCNNGAYVVLDHLRSPDLVPIKSLHTT